MPVCVYVYDNLVFHWVSSLPSETQPQEEDHSSFLLLLTVILHNGWCTVHTLVHTVGTHTHACIQYTQTHRRHMHTKAHAVCCGVCVGVCIMYSCFYNVSAAVTGSQQTNSREQNIFILRGWGWNHNKHVSTVCETHTINILLWRPCMSEQISECVSIYVYVGDVCVCVLGSCIRINSLVCHVRLCLANRFPSRQATWTQMSSPVGTFQEEDCPCDTYREGHPTGKEEVWVTARKVSVWLCHASTYLNTERAQDYINIRAYTLNLNALQQQHGHESCLYNVM